MDYIKKKVMTPIAIDKAEVSNVNHEAFNNIRGTCNLNYLIDST